jgi:outer membrane protein OmpA-like peptidoglycan-associated protein
MANPNSPYGGSSKDTSVNFAYNKFNLLPNQKKELDRMARTINKTGVTKITVRGHADSRGSVSYNMALSRLRAKTTAEYLKTKVKSPNVKFIVTAASLKEPIASNQTAKGMSANRRVDIVIPKPPKPPKKLYVGKGEPAGGAGRGPFGSNSDKRVG